MVEIIRKVGEPVSGVVYSRPDTAHVTQAMLATARALGELQRRHDANAYRGHTLNHHTFYCCARLFATFLMNTDWMKAKLQEPWLVIPDLKTANYGADSLKGRTWTSRNYLDGFSEQLLEHNGRSHSESKYRLHPDFVCERGNPEQVLAMAVALTLFQQGRMDEWEQVSRLYVPGESFLRVPDSTLAMPRMLSTKSVKIHIDWLKGLPNPKKKKPTKDPNPLKDSLEAVVEAYRRELGDQLSCERGEMSIVPFDDRAYSQPIVRYNLWRASRRTEKADSIVVCNEAGLYCVVNGIDALRKGRTETAGLWIPETEAMTKEWLGIREEVEVEVEFENASELFDPRAEYELTAEGRKFYPHLADTVLCVIRSSGDTYRKGGLAPGSVIVVTPNGKGDVIHSAADLLCNLVK